MADTAVRRVNVTVRHGDSRTDVAVLAGTDARSLATALWPRFRGWLELNGDTDATIEQPIPPGSVLTLVDEGLVDARREADEQRREAGELPRRRLLRVAVAALAVVLVGVPWVMTPMAVRLEPTSGPAAWIAAWVALGVGAAAAGGVTGGAWWSRRAARAHHRVTLSWGHGWRAGAAALLAFGVAHLGGLTLGLQGTTAAVIGVWLCAVCWLVVWAWTRATVMRHAAVAMFLGATVLTGMVLLPGGVGLLAPLVVAAMTAILVTAPQSAPQVPDDQLIDVPLLITSSPQTRHPAMRPPDAIRPKRARHLVREADTVWSLAVATGSVVIVAAAWPLTAVAAPSGLRGWGALATLLLALGILTFTPASSTLRIVRLAPRAAAIAVIIEWTIRLLGTHSPWPAWASALCLVSLGLVAFVLTLVSTRPGGAPLLGRIGDVTLMLAQLAIVPAAFLASGLFEWLWRASF